MNKNIILLLLIAVVILGGVWLFFGKDAKTDNVINEQDEVVIEETEEEKKVESILLDTEEEAGLVGFYKTEEREAWGEIQTCDQFVVVEGGAKFSQSFFEMIEAGNKLNVIDDEGRLVLNLLFTEADQEVFAKIKNSGPDNLITVTLTKKESELGKGSGPCYSFIEEVDVR